MRRTIIIAFVLAVLSESAAFGLQASPAKPHESAASATISHKTATESRKRGTKPATREAGQALGHAPKRQAGRATRHESIATTQHAAASKHTPGSSAHPTSHQRLSRTARTTNSCPSAKVRSKAKFRRVVYSYPVRKLAPAAKPYESKETPVASSASVAGTGRPVAAATGGADVVAAANHDVAETANSTVDDPAYPSAAEAVALRKTLKTMPPPLRGSLESLVRQNEKTEADSLERIEDDDDLADRIARGMLTPVPVSASLTVSRSGTWSRTALSSTSPSATSTSPAPLRPSPLRPRGGSGRERDAGRLVTVGRLRHVTAQVDHAGGRAGGGVDHRQIIRTENNP